MTSESAAGVPFDELPRLAGSGLRHSWGVHGPGDELGTVNRITGAAVARAARLVTDGKRLGLTLPVTLPDPPLFGREAVRHSIRKGTYGWGDQLDGFDLQVSSQWDGLRHIRGRSDGFYGGWMGDDTEEPERLGVHRWAEKGIVGRGVLADVAPGVADPFAGVAITPEEISMCLKDAGVEPESGDILCVRTGWAERYLALSPAEREALAAQFSEGKLAPWCGLLGSEDMARYLWDSGFSAVAVDNPGVEVSPGDPWFGTLHRQLIPGLGFAIGELFRFGPLAQACRARGRWEFFFVSVPLNVVGGVGSPANAVAIL
jgi:kynurenine formamidase